jgi:DNA-directed RNA polymerase specialized sigma subunit
MAKKPKAFQTGHDPMFATLAQEIARAIEKNKDGSSQKQQFEELVEAEELFKDTLLTYKIHRELYKRFILHIRVIQNNILGARPFFRENSETFSAKITPALKAKNPDALTQFRINFHLIKFFKDNFIGLWPKKLEAIYQRVEKARTILITNNLPLAINRAKIFQRKTSNNHLTFLDLVEVSSMGLCAAVDKYNPPYLKNFCGVIIGRAVGNLIDLNTETALHFYPGDRRILYRANSIRGRQGITDIAELAKAVNDSFAIDLAEGRTAPKRTDVNELSNLLAAASLLSADSNEGEEGYGVYNFTPDATEGVESQLGRKQELAQVAKLARKLPLINQKILRLKGIEI